MSRLSKDERNLRTLHRLVTAAIREYRLYALPRGLPRDVQRELLHLERVHRAASKGRAEILAEGRCPKCGCTDSAGCPEGCSWTKSGLCSSCAPARRRS